MEEGDDLPAFELEATGGIKVTRDTLLGKWGVLYFYPKDATSGCTKEGQDFRDHYPAFQLLKTAIYGISRDSVKSHENFKAKQQFPFALLSDPQEILCRQLDVIKTKMLYGKEGQGIERSTFLIDPNGKIRCVWRKVKVPGHVEEVLQTVENLQNQPL